MVRGIRAHVGRDCKGQAGLSPLLALKKQVAISRTGLRQGPHGCEPRAVSGRQPVRNWVLPTILCSDKQVLLQPSLSGDPSPGRLLVQPGVAPRGGPRPAVLGGS